MTIFQSTFPDVTLRNQSITDRVLEGLVNRPDAVVLTDGITGETMTAAVFMTRMRRLAGGLTAKGLGAGTTIALMAPNIPEYAVIFHAVAYAGGTITTINPAYTATEITHQLNDSGATYLITVPAFAETASVGMTGTKATSLAVIGTESYDALMGDPLPSQTPIDLDHHTVVLPYSSGTTGLPKGVMLSHRNLVVNLDQCLAAVQIQGDVTPAFLPFFHIYGMTVLMNVYLAGGGALVTMPRFDLPMFLQIIQDHKANRIWIVPPVGLALAKHPLIDSYDLSALKEIYIAAAASGVELAQTIRGRLNCLVLQGYGMTELAPVSHLATAQRNRDGAAGILVANTQARVVEIKTGADLGPDQEGELWIKGPQVMQGYLNNAKATAETIVADGWLRTGDIAKVDADGNMFIVDRLKELIKFKGFQVAPAELEAALIGLDGIIDAAVVGKPDPEAGEVPVGFVVLADGGPTEAAIMAHMKETLSSYKQLQAIHIVSEIPKSASGKILRRLLRDRLSQG